MNYTGFAGQILGWIVLLTAYVIVILGLFFLWSYFIFEILIRNLMKWFKVYDAFIQFIWDHRRYKSDNKKNNI